MAQAQNLGTGGAALNAQYGSVPGANTNAPLLLGHDGTNYVYLPGSTVNPFSSVDSAALDITGDLDVRVLVMLDSWNTGAEQALVAKFTNLSANRSWVLRIGTTGALQLVTSADGTAILTHTSSVVPSLFSGTAYWLRATIDVASGANRVVQFFQAPFSTAVPTVWTQIGTTITTAGTTSLFNSTAPLTIGSINAGLSTIGAGRFYRTQVLSGINGTVVFDANCMTGITSGSQTSFVESSVNAAMVTIQRATSGRKAVAVVKPVWLLGTDDYFEVVDSPLLDFTASQSATWIISSRTWATFGTSDALVAKSAGAGGWSLAASSTVATQTAGTVSDGATTVTATGAARTSGAGSLIAVVLDRTTQTLTVSTNGIGGTSVSTAAVGNLSTAEVMRIGRLSGAATEYLDSEVRAVAVWRRALTTAEITALLTYYGTA